MSKPGFDPNLFVDGIDSANWEMLNDSPDKPLLNRPLRGAYPPGSTIKPFLALSALSTGKRTPTQTIFDPGYFQIPGQAHRFRDDKPGGHGTVDMYKSIVVSCDTYYYILASETDIDDTARFLSQFGFGQKTGIDIDGELPGVLPSREWKRARFAGKDYREEHRKWYLGDSISAGIGQGYNAFTPIQQAHRDRDDRERRRRVPPAPREERPRRAHRRGARDRPRSLVHGAGQARASSRSSRTRSSACNKEGTSAAAFLKTPYVSAGKTGTAQVYSLKGEKYSAKIDERLRDHAWFIAYAPADKPRIAVAVLVENGGFGAQAAAPIARQVFDYYLTGEMKTGPAPDGSGARRDGRRERLMASVLARLWEVLTRKVDSFLFGIALAIAGVGLVTLFSASDQSVARITSQASSLAFALVLMWIVANIRRRRSRAPRCRSMCWPSSC